MVTLIIRACEVDALNGPDFVMVELSSAFVEMLGSRRALAQRLHDTDTDFDSLAFRDTDSVWFTYFEEQDDVFSQVSRDGWAAVSSGLFVPPEQGDSGWPALVKTDTERMQVWPSVFRFTCCIGNTEVAVRSESMTFQDLGRLLSAVSPGTTAGGDEVRNEGAGTRTAGQQRAHSPAA